MSQHPSPGGSPSPATSGSAYTQSPIELAAPGAKILVTPLPTGRHHIRVEKLDDSINIKIANLETAYDLDLIRLILDVKGPAFLCDEIARDESPEYTGAALKWSLLGYVDEEAFAHKRVLDFGCGSGASTTTLCRMFPKTSFIGVDIEEASLEIARARAKFYGLENVRFELSPTGTDIPPELGRFDHVVLCAVYEHLLPEERATLLPTLWAALEPGGVLFLRETPLRYFPIETHTTGLPLINYLPDRLTLWATRRYSRSWGPDVTWQELLRGGIRGATVHEIERLLRPLPGRARLLEPNRLGVEDRIDLWYYTVDKTRHANSKRRIYTLLKTLKRFTGLQVPPYLELAFRKEPLETHTARV